MIVYNVARGWFSMKNDAEAYRKTLGLKPDALFKLEIHQREELAWVLNQICSFASAEPAPEPPPAPVEVIDRARIVVDAPDFVPAFLLRDPPYAFR